MRKPVLVVLALLALLSSGTLVGTAHAQEELLPSAGRDSGVAITAAVQGEAFKQVSEGENAQFTVRFTDMSFEGTTAYTSNVLINCDIENQTVVERGWGLTMGLPPPIGRNQVSTMEVLISSGISPSPQEFRAEISCNALAPLNREIARFWVGARVDIYERFTLQTGGVVDPVNPDSDVTLRVAVQNSGNERTRFTGDLEAPEGWWFPDPPTVMIPPDTTQIVEIQGYSPREKLWYYKQSDVVEVSYWPEGSPQKSQSMFVPVQVDGIYMHPALGFLVFLGACAFLVLLLLIVYARRTVEEQVLGKPIPPWRIPVEREHLKKLEKEDPDEFYIVRYHLMEEEHSSALLWYKHFKHATRKDRKRERKWLKKQERVNNRTRRLRGRQDRLEKKMARRLRVLPVRRRLRLQALNGSLVKAHWREQRRLLKVHRKGIKRIDKIHRKKVKAEAKEHLAEYEKERKQVEKENRKRTKQGEYPLPLPEKLELEHREPDFPQVVEVPLASVDKSSLALRAQRLSQRYKRRIARRTQSAKKRMHRKRAKVDQRTERLKSRIPKPPSTHIYDEDEFVPEDEVVVEEGRQGFQRLLGLPPMETREALRRRRMVYKVKIQQAKRADQTARVNQLKQEYTQERDRLLDKEGSRASQDPTEKEGPSSTEASSKGGLAFLSRKRRPGERGERKKGGRREEAGGAAKQASIERRPEGQENGPGEARPAEE